jgi:hypothetical protein
MDGGAMKFIFLGTALLLMSGALASIQPQNLSLPPQPAYQLGPNPQDLGPRQGGQPAGAGGGNDLQRSESSRSDEIQKPPIELAPSSILATGEHAENEGILAPQAQSSMGFGFAIPLDLGTGPQGFHRHSSSEPGEAPENFGAAKARSK